MKLNGAELKSYKSRSLKKKKMAFDSKFIDYGVIKVEGDKVKLYSTSSNHIYISVGKSVTNAVWSGDTLNVYLSDGKVRRYTSPSNYTTV